MDKAFSEPQASKGRRRVDRSGGPTSFAPVNDFLLKVKGGIAAARGRARTRFIDTYASLSSGLPSGYALAPLQIIIELTHRCNLRCKMCYIYNEIDKKHPLPNTKKELDEGEIAAIIRQFPPRTRFTFTGGEPFARSDIMEILRKTRKSHRCGIGTNGTIISDDQCEGLVDLGIDFLQVSLDGPRSVHDQIRRRAGAFDKTTDTIARIQEIKKQRGSQRPWFYLNCTITSGNDEVLDQVVEVAEMLGVENVTFQVVTGSTNNSGVQVDERLDDKVGGELQVEAVDIAALEHSLGRIEELRQKTSMNIMYQGNMTASEVLTYYQGRFDLSSERCIFPWVNAFISPYGEMFPCYGYSVGQLNGSNALALWNGSGFRKFRKKLKESRIFPSCLGCCHMRRHGGW